MEILISTINCVAVQDGICQQYIMQFQRSTSVEFQIFLFSILWVFCFVVGVKVGSAG